MHPSNRLFPSRDISAIFFVLLSTMVGGCFGGTLYRPGMASNPVALGPGASLDPPLQEGASDYWQMEHDVRLFHFSAGRGRNILFVHGGPGIPPTKTYPGLDLFKDRYRIHYYHQRGCGKSSRPFDRFRSGSYYSNMQELVRRLGFRAQVADIERIRRLLGDDKLILVGHSFGAFLAALYAAEFPDRVDTLILISPAGVVRMPPPSGGLYAQVERHLSSEKRRTAFEQYQKRLFNFGTVFSKNEKELAAIQNEFAPYYSEAARNAGSPVVETGFDPALSGGWSVMAAYFDLGRDADFRPLIQKIKAPTLILYGERDLLPAETFMDYSAIPDSRFLEIPGAGHFPFVEQPRETAKPIIDFLEGSM